MCLRAVELAGEEAVEAGLEFEAELGSVVVVEGLDLGEEEATDGPPLEEDEAEGAGVEEDALASVVVDVLEEAVALGDEGGALEEAAEDWVKKEFSGGTSPRLRASSKSCCLCLSISPSYISSCVVS